jgi:hypothetical protein
MMDHEVVWRSGRCPRAAWAQAVPWSRRDWATVVRPNCAAATAASSHPVPASWSGIGPAQALVGLSLLGIGLGNLFPMGTSLADAMSLTAALGVVPAFLVLAAAGLTLVRRAPTPVRSEPATAAAPSRSQSD